MGTRVTSFGWVPYHGLGTPLFLRRSITANLIGHPQEARTDEPPEALRCGGSFHQIRSPVWEKGWGCFESPVRGQG